MGKTCGKRQARLLLCALCLTLACFIAGNTLAPNAEASLSGEAATPPTTPVAGAHQVAASATSEVAAEADSGSSAQWVTVEFNDTMNIQWDWNDLLQDATTAGENARLAVAGIVMSQAAELSSLRVEAVLEELGFSDLISDYYKLSTGTKNDVFEPARTFGHKLVEKDGKQYHIICAVFKGTTTLDDALTDIASIEDGFYEAGANCEASLATYANSIKGATKDNTVLFITGHSLGASTANVVGRLSGDLANDSAKFVYTFASPNYEVGDDAASSNAFANFHTFTNTDDVVPKVPLSIAPTYFQKIGAEHTYTFSALSSEQSRKFNKAYRYFTGKWFEDDGVTSSAIRLKNHLCQTYMSFVLSDFDDELLERYLGMSRENPIEVAVADVAVNPSKKTKLKSSAIFTVTNAQGAVTYAKSAGTSDITVARNGTVTVAKSTKPWTYSVAVAVSAAGDNFYHAKTVNKVITVKVKRVNPMTAKGKTATVKAGAKTVLKRAKVLDVQKAKGKVTYTKKSGNKKIVVAKNGKVTVKKGLKAGKTYKVRVAVRAAGDSAYGVKTVTRIFRIKVKKA